MIAVDTLRLWERQRQLLAAKERERRTRVILEDARRRIRESMAMLRVT